MKRLLFILLLSFSFVYTQNIINGSPYSFTDSKLQTIKFIEMPEVDLDKLLIEDKNVAPGTPFRYGKIFYVDYNLNNSGTWEVLDDGSRLWRLEIHSKGAFSIGIEYDYFHLPKGARFYIYNPSQENVFGAYSSLNNQQDYRFATPLVKGDNIILEYFEPHDIDFQGRINISQIIHDYKDALGFFNEDDNPNRSCGTNVVCPEADPYEDLINAASWLDMGGSICSGSMLNNQRMDLEPYYITAWHCTDGDNPSTFRFYFEYEASSCNDDWASAGPYAYGSLLLSASNGMDPDYSLLKISGDILDSWDVFYAGWDRSYNYPVISCGIHHPGGAPKKINIDDDTAYTASWNNGPPSTHWRVFWDSGGTEGGSSGSPLYDENFRFRGQLSGGPTDFDCEEDGNYSLYGRFDRAWEDVKQWLDPENTGAMFIDGTYDGTEEIQGCTDPFALNYDQDAIVDDGTCEYPSLGDINNDAQYNVIDIVLLINYLLDDIYIIYGDLNQDGIINILDIVILINLILDREVPATEEIY